MTIHGPFLVKGGLLKVPEVGELEGTIVEELNEQGYTKVTVYAVSSEDAYLYYLNRNDGTHGTAATQHAEEESPEWVMDVVSKEGFLCPGCDNELFYNENEYEFFCVVCK